jgi:hypothetical protein
VTQILWRSAEAVVLARQGQADEAERVSREAVEIAGTTDSLDTGTAWIDKKLNFAIKWEGEKTVAELQNIQEGPQDASLFEVPKDYQKMDTAAAHKSAKKKISRPLPPAKPQPPAQ